MTGFVLIHSPRYSNAYGEIMDFAFTEDQLLIQKTFRQFALEKVLPNAPRWDRGEPITKEVIKEVAAR